MRSRDHHNVQPVFDVYANIGRRDQGGVRAQVRRIVGEMTPQLPRGAALAVRGQVETVRTSFAPLGLGLIAAVILVYLLMVVNPQSGLNPFITLMLLPSAVAGVLRILFAPQTTPGGAVVRSSGGPYSGPFHPGCAILA